MATGTDLVGSSAITINLTNKNIAHSGKGLDEFVVNESNAWAFGDALNQIEALFHDSRSTDDTGESLVLNTGATGNGAMVDAFGNTITIGVLKLLYIKNTHATLSLWVGGAVNTIQLLSGDTDKIVLGPGASIFWQDPTGVTLADEDTVKVACSTAATITYDIAFAGEDL